MSTEAPEAAPEAAPNTAPAPESASNDGFGSSLDAFFAQADAELAQIPTAAAAEAPAAPEKTKPTSEKPADSAERAPTDPLDEVDGLKDWTPQAARRFKEVKAEAKLAKQRAAELEQQVQQREARLAELEALANDPKVKELTSRTEEYEQTMLLRDLENSRAYKTLVREPLERITGEIDALADKYSISGDDLIDVVVMDDEAAQEERLSELLAHASDRDKFRLYKLIEETKPVLSQRSALMENAREALHEVQELERQQERAALVEQAQRRSSAAKEVAKRIEAKLPFLASFDEVDMEKLAELAGQTDYAKLDPAIGTYQTMAGHLLPKLATQYLSLQREIASLTEKLAEYDRTGSPLNGGHTPGGHASRSSSAGSFLEAVEAAFPR